MNSAKSILQQMRRAGFAQTGVYFHAAWQVKIAVHFVLGSRHLHHQRVVDPVAHLVRRQVAVRDRRREGEGRGVQFRQFQMEIHGIDIAGLHGLQLLAFANRVGAGEIHPELIAQH